MTTKYQDKMSSSLRWLYRDFLKEARKIKNYNYQQFAIRKIQYDFRETTEKSRENVLQSLLQLQRIRVLTNMYYQGESVLTTSSTR
jgi:hypothetical protein